MSTRPLAWEDLYRIPFVGDVQLAPDGSRVAFVVTQADEATDESHSSIWVVTTDGNAEPQPLTRGPHDSSPRWSPDGQRLAFVSKREGDDRAQLYVLPMAAGEARRAIRAPGGVSAPAWSPDGTRVAFLSVIEPDEDGDDEDDKASTAPIVIRRLGYKADGAGLLKEQRSHLFVCGIDEGAEPVQLTSGDADVGPPAWSPDGNVLAFTGSFGADRDLAPVSHVYTVEAAGGEPRQVTDHRGMAAAPVFTPDASRIVFAGSDDVAQGHTRLFAVATEGGVPEPVATDFDRNVMVGAPAYPGGLPALTADGSTVVFCARDRGCTHLYAVAAAGGRPEKVFGSDDTVVAGLSLAPHAGRIAFVVATPDTCGEVWVADPDGTNATQLTRMVGGALADAELRRPEARQFASPDGTPVHGWVLRDPDATAPGPLLVDVHGGPHNAWSPVFDGIHLYHQALVAKGWTILFVNPRGSDGYGEAFYTALLKDGWGVTDVDDFLAPIDALVEDGLADPQRIVVTGYSYGGFMTNLLTVRTGRFAAAISGGCVSNLVSMGGTCDLPILLPIELDTTVAEGLERLIALSPIAHVANVRTPTLILHGQADDRCPVSQAEEWFAALRQRQVETELVLYPGESHLFIAAGAPSHRIDYCRRVAEWAEAHT